MHLSRLSTRPNEKLTPQTARAESYNARAKTKVHVLEERKLDGKLMTNPGSEVPVDAHKCRR